MVDEEQQQPEPDRSQAVAVAYVHQDEVMYSWHHSMTQLLALDASNSGRIWTGGYVAIRGGTDGLADARNSAVREFLADSTAGWLWWVDTDMGFAPDTVERLFEAADPTERPVVGGLCFANREVENDGMGGRRGVAAPVIMHWTHDGTETGFDVRWDYPTNTLVRCDGIGSACVLIHRSVFERVQEQYGPDWYSRARNPSTGALISEDLSFCCRLMALGIPVHVHTGVLTTHAKRIWLGQEDYWRQRALNPPPPTVLERAGNALNEPERATSERATNEPNEPASAPERANAPVSEPARSWLVPRYAIVPTRNRPARLLGLVGALGPQCDLVLVLDNGSVPPVDLEKLEAAAGRAHVQVIRDDEQPPNLARFWNVMFEMCRLDAVEHEADSWDVAVLNDDSLVPAGWYDACSDALRSHTSAVIAHTNPTEPALLTELHNEPSNRMCPHAFVMRGESNFRADESMAWWYFDTDLDWRARLAGGVLYVHGPVVLNSLANSTTVGPLARQAEKDRVTFEKKWAER